MKSMCDIHFKENKEFRQSLSVKTTQSMNMGLGGIIAASFLALFGFVLWKYWSGRKHRY